MSRVERPGCRKIRVDCAQRRGDEVIALVAEALPPAGPDLHVAIVLENLAHLRGSMAGLIAQLVKRLVGSTARACLVEPCGFANAFLEEYGRWLPLAVYDDESALESPKDILVVEDSEDGAEFLGSLLESGGHRCESVRTVAAACLLLDSVPFDLVLLDLRLPDDEGFEVARRLRERGKLTPVVAVSGFLDFWPAEKFERFGIRRRIPKPLRAKEILDAVQDS